MVKALQTNDPSKHKKSSSGYKTAKNVPQLFFLVSMLSFCTFSCGYLIAYIVALGVKNLRIIYGETAVIPVVRAFLIASLPFGVSFGSLIGPSVIQRATRRQLYFLNRNLTLILNLFLLILYGVIQIQSLIAFFIVRALQGVLIGVYLILIPLYIKQITPKQISTKSLFGVFEKMFLLFGFVVPFGFNIIMVKADLDQIIRWRILVTANALSTVIAMIFIFVGFIPQSPISLIQKQKELEAKKVIRLFHQQKCVDQVYAQKVKMVKIIEKIERHIGHSQKHTCKLRTFLTFQVPIVHQLTGVNAYISQMGLVVSSYNVGFSDYVPFLMTSVQLLALISSLFYITKATPRKIILIGNIGMSLCCFGIGGGLIMADNIYGGFWMTVVFITMFMGLNGGTFIPASGIYVSQVGIRRHVRWSLVTNWFAAATSVVLFVTIGYRVGYAAVFIGFGVIALIGFIFNIRYMIETTTNPKCSHIQLRIKKKCQAKQSSIENKHDSQETDKKPGTYTGLPTSHTLNTKTTLMPTTQSRMNTAQQL